MHNYIAGESMAETRPDVYVFTFTVDKVKQSVFIICLKVPRSR